MRRSGVRSLLFVMATILPSIEAGAQVSSLPVDSELLGASLTAGSISFHNTGSLAKGVLKNDYVRDGLTFKAGTQIEFFADGRVMSGTLGAGLPLPGRNDIVLLPGPIKFHATGGIASAALKAGSRHLNIVLPIDMLTGFTIDGYFASMSPVSTSFLTYSFEGRTLRNGNNVDFAYDRLEDKYLVTRGMVGANQIVASLVTARNAYGIPTAVIPVVVPPLSTFTLHAKNPVYSENPQYDYWYYEGQFAINGYNFGLRPRLYLKENRLFSVQIGQALTIDGVAYPANSVIVLNDVGKIIK